MTNMYNAHIEIDERNFTPDRAVSVMEKLVTYHCAPGTSRRGRLELRLTLPAENIEQATSTAVAVAEHATGNKVVRLDIMPESEFEAIQGYQPIPELMSVTEAAEALGMTRQRILQMIAEHKFPSATKIGSTIVLAQTDVEAKLAK